MNEIVELNVEIVNAIAPDGECLELVEIVAEFREGRPPRRGKIYRTLIDDHEIDFHHDKVPEPELLKRVGKSPLEGWAVYEVLHGREVKLNPGQTIYLRRHGLERFFTRQDLVTIIVNHIPKQVRAGYWTVSKLKAAVGVPPEKVLALIKPDHTFDNLDDEAEIDVCEGQQLISHARRGGSS